jgi:hypothetical protein
MLLALASRPAKADVYDSGDTLSTVEVSITSMEFGGTTYFDQTLNFTASNCAMNPFGFNMCTETASFDLSLPGGTFWLNLQNATVPSGDPAYWDEWNGIDTGGQQYLAFRNGCSRFSRGVSTKVQVISTSGQRRSKAPIRKNTRRLQCKLDSAFLHCCCLS